MPAGRPDRRPDESTVGKEGDAEMQDANANAVEEEQQEQEDMEAEGEAEGEAAGTAHALANEERERGDVGKVRCGDSLRMDTPPMVTL